MNSKPKLYYFSVRALGQFPRVLFAYLNIDYENIHVDTILNEEFRNENLKFGQVPMLLLEDGFKLTQTTAICKFIAKQNNFIGNSPQEEAIIDETLASVHSDLVVQAIRAAKGEISKEKIIEIQIPRVFGAFDQILSKNKYIVGDNITLADVYVYVAYDYFVYLGYGNEISKFSNLQRLKNHFESNSGVQNYLSTRPGTVYQY
ncbi:hypothetical protein DICPUDRAFT_93288 [Dictyostelium purpureum]|uniref:Glutathione S-transferase n=1 Tax=Dictyostelium purpureum TaxID=5786 RepID=F1A554_DICPU|nr:uncharacterized protein DICPUDRAFT_93288 [Dictyostelium purpureum]EGC28674.1 hypothetical protein DICPUDRAFT_93288 [Dictyostelium purpureum]|eukprot:XP_003294798.1 hypothetical protein DICPUDRAFT_93288 [Dictyostelium purpureum]